MDLKEAIKSGKRFRLRFIPSNLTTRWYEIGEDGGIYYDKKTTPITFAKDAILSNNWETEEKWYEGDFRTKYPNGVFCKVTLSNSGYVANLAVTDYCKGEGLPFKTGNCGAWRFAKPVSPKYAPAIIEEEAQDE